MTTSGRIGKTAEFGAAYGRTTFVLSGDGVKAEVRVRASNPVSVMFSGFEPSGV
jgi:hypothetical protein